LHVLGYDYPDQLAIDSTTGNLYFTALEWYTGYIGVMAGDGSSFRILVSDLDTPREIAVYPKKG
jgi:hypothetical protein